MPEELRRRMAELPFRELYEVGGSLRDEALGRAPKDVDFLVRGLAVEELRAVLAGAGHADELRRGRAPRGGPLLAALGAARGRRGRRAAARATDSCPASPGTAAIRTPTS